MMRFLSRSESSVFPPNFLTLEDIVVGEWISLLLFYIQYPILVHSNCPYVWVDLCLGVVFSGLQVSNSILRAP